MILFIFTPIYAVFPLCEKSSINNEGKEEATDCYYTLYCSGPPSPDQPALAWNTIKTKNPVMFTNQAQPKKEAVL